MSEAMINPTLGPAGPGLASGSATGGGDPGQTDAARAAAQEFEAIFLAQLLGTMTRGLSGEGLLGGGQGEVFGDMLNDEVAKLISRSGGIGVADTVLQEMLKIQEVA